MKKHQEQLDWKLLFGAMIVVLCLSYVVAYQRVGVNTGIFSSYMKDGYGYRKDKPVVDNIEKPKMIDLSIGKAWSWSMTRDYDDKKVIPKTVDAFTLTFTSTSTFSGTTDCNSFFGSYTDDGHNITFNEIGSTKMACENSQETEFLNSLKNVKEYKFSKSNDLVMILKENKGVMVFSLK